MTVVADTSALVSLGVVAAREESPLALLLDRDEVLVPEAVVGELREVASFDDEHAAAASTVLESEDDLTVVSVALDASFPLDAGENAAVTLANERDADLLLCDEFTDIGLVHASLADTRLATTPTLLSVFVEEGRLTAPDAVELLDAIAAARSREANSYVRRARSRLAA